MLQRMLVMSVLMGVTLFAGGCVSSGKYQLKEKESLEQAATIAKMQQEYTLLAAQNTELRSTVKKFVDDVARAGGELERLAATNKGLENSLKSTADQKNQKIAGLSQAITQLEKDNDRLRGEIDRLKKAKEEEVRQTSKTYEDMLEQMKGEISQGQVTISELKGKLTVNMLNAILFDSGKAEVKPEGLAVLQKVIDILKTVKDKTIRIEGHTDTIQIAGELSRKYPTNWELSAARAINVARYLQQQGIDPAQLAAVAYGEYKPVAANDSEEGKARNRRIEIILVPKE